MSLPKFRRRYELLSFLLNAALPLFLVVVLLQQHIELAHQSQKIEDLRADIATIKLNTPPYPNAASFTQGYPHSSSTPAPTK